MSKKRPRREKDAPTTLPGEPRDDDDQQIGFVCPYWAVSRAESDQVANMVGDYSKQISIFMGDKQRVNEIQVPILKNTKEVRVGDVLTIPPPPKKDLW